MIAPNRSKYAFLKPSGETARARRGKGCSFLPFARLPPSRTARLYTVDAQRQGFFAGTSFWRVKNSTDQLHYQHGDQIAIVKLVSQSTLDQKHYRWLHSLKPYGP